MTQATVTEVGEGGAATKLLGRSGIAAIRSMSANTKIAVGVAGGYLLGRTKKAKMALMLASLLGGKRLATHRAELLEHGQKLLCANAFRTRAEQQEPET